MPFYKLIAVDKIARSRTTESWFVYNLSSHNDLHGDTKHLPESNLSYRWSNLNNTIPCIFREDDIDISHSML